MLLAGLGLVRMGKNCDRGLENAARGLRPRAAFSRPRSQFFTIRTSQPANNIYNYDFRHFFFKAMTFETPRGTAAVILGFKTPSSTNSQISPPERYDEHPRYF